MKGKLMQDIARPDKRSSTAGNDCVRSGQLGLRSLLCTLLLQQQLWRAAMFRRWSTDAQCFTYSLKMLHVFVQAKAVLVLISRGSDLFARDRRWPQWKCFDTEAEKHPCKVRQGKTPAAIARSAQGEPSLVSLLQVTLGHWDWQRVTWMLGSPRIITSVWVCERISKTMQSCLCSKERETTTLCNYSSLRGGRWTCCDWSKPV